MASEPSILGPHGEGYCAVCRFIEPLDTAGRIAFHRRGMHLPTGGVECKGSYRRPGRAPWRSVKAMFRTAVKGRCPVCGKDAPLMQDGVEVPYVSLHPGTPASPHCRGSYRAPVGR